MTLTTIYALLCAAIAARLVTFRRGASTYRPFAAGLAYALAVAAGMAPIRALFGVLPSVGLGTTVLVGVLCVAVYGVRGNVAHLLWSGRR